MSRSKALVVAVLVLSCTALTTALGGTVTYELKEKNLTDFQNLNSETPAVVDGPWGYWRADETDSGQHLIYVQGGKPGIEPDSTDGVNPELLWNDTKSIGDGGAGRPATNVTMDDIVSLSWRTNKPGDVNASDWFVDIYTKADLTTGGEGDDDRSWYGSNFEFSAATGDTSGYSAGNWTTWGAAADGSYQDPSAPDVFATQIVRHYQGNNAGQGVGGSDFSNPYYLDDLASSSGEDPEDWAGEEIQWLALATGSGSPGSQWGDFAGKLDWFQFTYNTTGDPADDETVIVNFTPEPTSGILLLIGLAATLLRRKPRT